ncbi:Wzz/FepE/Etk N-terminal domain-containing protein [Massilia agilis]|uniref:Wzz/FepE/Etk N-terminal domain-containing protein n=1 Tax=Massilia agilis TaxID=1811226 RepID=A0ABT2DAH3_9BURK|nr:Wzz/FepE/Etk N-terminal domain-containing protein [Massilia agilis]MCS0807453.1 Wzz/FepE/Etk N-terminal domain-containing protein [Massilia agilis]
MSQSENLEREQAPAPGTDEIGMIDLLIALAKHKKAIAALTVAAAVISLGISFVLPNVYLASTRLLPPQQTQSSAAALLSQLGGLAGGGAAVAAGLKNPNDLYVGMLRSRTIADRLIAQFDLKKVYATDSQEIARKRLETNTTISSGKDGLILIEVEDENKKLVAPMANAYVGELFRLMKTLAVTDAAQRRLFYEHQLEATKDNLAKAEAALKRTMESHGVISVDSESRAILETVARLKAQVSAKEIQLTSMRAFVTNTNPDYRRVEEELNGLRTELAKLENGRGADRGDTDKDGGLANIKLLRDLKYQQMLYEVLAKQYEVARMDEAKDPSVIQVLDPAIEPERKFKPKRAALVFVATVLAMCAAIAWAFVVEFRDLALKYPGRAEKLKKLKSALRGA